MLEHETSLLEFHLEDRNTREMAFYLVSYRMRGKHGNLVGDLIYFSKRGDNLVVQLHFIACSHEMYLAGNLELAINF